MSVPTSPSAQPSLGGWELYQGEGEKREKALPPYVRPPGYKSPEGYRADQGVRDAVNVAIMLGQPLLLTGEPGTGKSQLAWSVAHELGLGDPLVFNTKSTSAAGDLFYRYDALRRFHDAQAALGPWQDGAAGQERTDLAPDRYITYEALGKAILLAMDPDDPKLPKSFRGHGPRRSVVLVDEVDKAPRDLPNDILNEIDSMEFEVRESGQCFSADVGNRPIILMTSNSEKDLPDAFLRRCIYYHIPFPDTERLLEILASRLPKYAGLHSEAVAHFEAIRALELKKRPATAELISWLRVLATCGVTPDDLKTNNWGKLGPTYGALLKTQPDRDKVLSYFWPKAR